MSSMPITLEKLQELITCSLCLDTYTAPKALQCLHTYCEGCLRDVVKISRFQGKRGYKCPSCRKFTFEVDLKSNFHTVQLVDLYTEATQPRKCVHCKSNDAAWKCNDCVEYFCDKCKEGHLSIRVLRHHKMTPAKDEETKLVINKPVICEKHPEEILKYNCKVCDTLLCITCALLDHEGHKYETITDALTRCLPEIAKLSDEVRRKADRQAHHAKQLMQRKEKVQAGFESALKLANEQKTAIIAKAEKDFEIVKSKLTEIKENEESKAENESKNEEGKAAELRAVVECVENTLRTAEGAPLMVEIRQQLFTRLTNAIKDQRDARFLSSIEIPGLEVSTSLNMPGNSIGDVYKLSDCPNIRVPATDFSTTFKENLEPTNVFSIEYAHAAKGYRMACGFGKVFVCFWDICTIAAYASDGKRLKDIVLKGTIVEPQSAIIVDPSSIVVAGTNGVFLVDIASAAIKRKYADGTFCDINLIGNKAYALCYKDGTIWTVKKRHDWETAEMHSVATGLGAIAGGSTLVATASAFYICDYRNNVYEFNLEGVKINTITCTFLKPLLCAVNTNKDMLMCSATMKNKYCVITKDKQSKQNTLSGATKVLDIIIESTSSFWVLDKISLDPLKVEVKHYVLP